MRFGIYLQFFLSTKCCEREWRQLAQFEAVRRPATCLCFSSRGDCVEVAGEIVLTVILLKVYYNNDNTYDIVDMNCKNEWHADIPFNALRKIMMRMIGKRHRKRIYRKSLVFF